MKGWKFWRTQAETPPGRQTRKNKRGHQRGGVEKEMMNIITVSVKYCMWLGFHTNRLKPPPILFYHFL